MRRRDRPGAGRRGATPDDFWRERKADPFELWLRRGLREAFGAISAEAVPENLLRLIEEDRAERERIRRRRRAEPESGGARSPPHPSDRGPGRSGPEDPEA